MKKIFFLFFVAGMFSLISCGPSAEELAAAEKAKQDSIAKVQADSLAAVAEQVRLDSIAAAEAEQKRINDSIAAAEEAAKKNNKGKTPKTKVPVNETKVPALGKDGRKSN